MDRTDYRIDGLTTLGHSYLVFLSNDSKVDKFKKFLVDNASKITVDSLVHFLRSYLQ